MNCGPISSVYNPISGSLASTTGSISSGSSSLALASAIGWSAGMGIRVTGAGPVCSVSTPAQPTVAVTGGSGTNRSYQIVALDGLGGYSAAGTASANASSSISLDRVNNYVTVSLTPMAGVAAYLVFRSSTLIEIVPNSSGGGYTSIQIKDYGQTITLTGTPDLPTSGPPVASHNQALVSSVASLSGTTATLSAAASATVTSATILHDDSPLIQAAVNMLSPASGGQVWVPGATYVVNTPIVVGSVAPVTDAHGYEIIGAGLGQTLLQSGVALAGLPFIKLINADQCRISGIQFVGNASAPPLAAIELNENQPHSGAIATGECLFESLGINWVPSTAPGSIVHGVIITAAPSYDNNNQLNRFVNCNFTNTIESGLYIGHSNSLENQIFGCAIGGGNYGIYLNGGSFSSAASSIGATNDVDGCFHYYLGPGTYYHDIEILGCDAEDESQSLYTDANALSGTGATRVSMIACHESSGATGNVFNCRSAQIEIILIASHLSEGVSNATAVFNADTTLRDCRCGLSTLTYNGNFTLERNYWAPGSVTLTNSGSGTLKLLLGNIGGGIQGTVLDAPASTAQGTFTVKQSGTTVFAIDGSGEANFTGKRLYNVPSPSAAGDALSEGGAIGVQAQSSWLGTSARVVPVAYASLPAASGNEGMLRAVTDSTTNTWGATISGSGTHHVLAYSDGTNWTVVGA
jgi:hypothetical protein